MQAPSQIADSQVSHGQFALAICLSISPRDAESVILTSCFQKVLQPTEMYPRPMRGTEMDRVMQSAICNLRARPCNLQSAICNMQSAICNLQSAICNLSPHSPSPIARQRGSPSVICNLETEMEPSVLPEEDRQPEEGEHKDVTNTQGRPPPLYSVLVTDCRLQIADCNTRIGAPKSDCRLQIADCRLRGWTRRFQVSGCRSRSIPVPP